MFSLLLKFIRNIINICIDVFWITAKELGCLHIKLNRSTGMNSLEYAPELQLLCRGKEFPAAVKIKL